MKRIQAIEISVGELIELLQVLTDSVELEGYEDENWKEAFSSTYTIEEILDEKIIREKILEHLGINEIRCYVKSEDTIILV